MAGTPLQAERVPTAALLDVVLLATAAREYCEAEILDDYQALLERTEEEWRRPDFTHRVFDSQHGNWANWILKGRRDFPEADTAYIPDWVGGVLRSETPSYFVRELDETESVGGRKRRRAA